jgi:hypothetical protein
MAIGIERYGLKENPFGFRTLRCADNPIDRSRFELIHTLNQKDIENHIAKTDAIGPAFFLVIGQSGSGRTVVASYLVADYRDFRKIPSSNFAFAEHDPKGNESSKQVLTNLLAVLASRTKALGANFKAPAAIINEGLTAPYAADFQIHYREIITAYSNAMKDLGGSFGCVLERPAKLEILQDAVQIFEEGVGTLAFTHYGSEDTTTFLRKVGDLVFPVRLQLLSSDKAYQLAEQRWVKWDAINPLPFDKSGLNRCFQQAPRTVGRTLELLKKSIEMKLLVYGEGPAWPADPNLAFPPDQIENIFKWLDTNP